MSSLFGFEAPRAVLFVIAFALILALVVLFGVVFRKLTGARLMVPGNDRSRSRQPRLGIVDVYDLDRQRQLILLRRDNVEHLLLIGGPNDVVIETNIVRVAGARIPAPSGDMGAERFEPSLDQAPRAPQVEPNGRPSIETQLAAQLGAFVRRPSEESDIDEELAPVVSVSAPVPAHPEPVLKPDAVAASAPPSLQGLRAEARTPSVQNTPPAPPPPPPPAERPEPRPHFTPPPFQSRATPVPPAPPVQPPEPVRAPQQAETERAGPDAALLSDMAKQLEEALKRPASPVPPPPVAPPAPVPVASPAAHGDIREEEDDRHEPIPAGEKPVASHDEPVVEEDFDEEPEAPAPAQAAPPVAPVRPAPPPPPVTAPLPPQAKEPAPAPQKPADPFSVEDIEAEFARLLGRPLDPNKKG